MNNVTVFDEIDELLLEIDTEFKSQREQFQESLNQDARTLAELLKTKHSKEFKIYFSLGQWKIKDHENKHYEEDEDEVLNAICMMDDVADKYGMILSDQQTSGFYAERKKHFLSAECKHPDAYTRSSYNGNQFVGSVTYCRDCEDGYETRPEDKE